MAVYQLYETQKIPASLDQVWDFIKSPKNLKEITPDYMGFEITSKYNSDVMYEGMIISYKVSPLLGIKMTWVTEITKVKDKQFFIDEQRIGPYKMWHHEHRLKLIDGGVEMTDLISYALPMGPLGDIAHKIFVKRQLDGIFDYRKEVVEKKFGVWKG